MLLKMNASRDTLQPSSLSPNSITHKGEPKSPKRRHPLKKIKHSQIREMVNQTELRASGFHKRHKQRQVVSRGVISKKSLTRKDDKFAEQQKVLLTIH